MFLPVATTPVVRWLRADFGLHGRLRNGSIDVDGGQQSASFYFVFESLPGWTPTIV